MDKWSFQHIRELMAQIALRGMDANELGCARISMMARSINSKTRPDTLVRDHRLQSHDFPLQRTAGPYMGQYRKSREQRWGRAFHCTHPHTPDDVVGFFDAATAVHEDFGA